MGLPAALGISGLGVPVQGDQANAVVSGTLPAIGPSIPFAFYGPFNLFLWSDINTALTTTAGSLTATVGSATGLGVGDSVNSVKAPAGATIGVLSGTTATLALPPISLYGSINPQQDKIFDLAESAGLLGATIIAPHIPAGATVTAIDVVGIPNNGTQPPVKGVVSISAAPTATNKNEPIIFEPTGNAILVSGTDANATFTGATIAYTGDVQVERSFDGGKTWVVCNVGGQGTLAQFPAGTPVSVVIGEPERGNIYRLNCIAYTSGAINYRMSATGAAAVSLAVASVI